MNMYFPPILSDHSHVAGVKTDLKSPMKVGRIVIALLP